VVGAPHGSFILNCRTSDRKIETELATAGPAETRRLRQRAELIRELLAPPWQSAIPP
jgi:hypothetical protein